MNNLQRKVFGREMKNKEYKQLLPSLNQKTLRDHTTKPCKFK